MASPIPNEWGYVPPESIVAGDGPYAIALAAVFGTVILPLDQLKAEPEPNDAGGYPQVFEQLARAFLVVSEGMSAADALQCHQAVWDWVGKLAPACDQHELAFVFILPPDASNDFEESLAAGLGISKIDPITTGHAVWRRSGSLTELLGLLTKIRPMDFLPLRAHRAANIKHVALAKLRATIAMDDATAIRRSAREVLAVFSGCEYLLDVFCRPPSHQNGNLLRRWLNTTVTDVVTPKEQMVIAKQVADWLLPDQVEHTP